MNRRQLSVRLSSGHVPHRRGDEPATWRMITMGRHVPHRRGDEPMTTSLLMLDHVPHRRGDEPTTMVAYDM